MKDYDICKVCFDRGTLKTALETKEIYSNLRKFNREKFTVWRCSGCNSIHSKEALNLEYYYEDYLVGSKLDYFLRSAYKARLSLLRKNGFRKHHHILDYGCNQGLFLLFLSQLGYDNAFGYDPYIPKYSDINILETKYDFITAYDVLEHVEDPNKTLAELASFLNRDGIIVVGTPNADEVSLSRPDLELHQPFHRHILSEKSLRDMASSVDLDVVGFNKRWYLDTLYPFVNARFILTYVRKSQNLLDVLVEPPNWTTILLNPQLILYGFVGYFYRWQGNMTAVMKIRENYNTSRE